MKDNNYRVVDGQPQHRRFAYRKKDNPSFFGLLRAVDEKDCRMYFGNGFAIRPTWLTQAEEEAARKGNTALVSKIVSRVIPVRN